MLKQKSRCKNNRLEKLKNVDRITSKIVHSVCYSRFVALPISENEAVRQLIIPWHLVKLLLEGLKEPITYELCDAAVWTE